MTPIGTLRAGAVACATLLVVALAVAPSAGGAFPGRNGKIAYTGLGATTVNVYTVWANGSGTRLAVRNASDPAWSPDGTRIAFVRAGADGYAHIYVKDMRTGVVTQITSNRRSDMYPAWSPNGARIAFSSFLPGTGAWDGTYWIKATRPFGTRQLILAPRPHAWAEDLAWSPGGTRLAFAYYVDGHGINIATMPIGRPWAQPTILTTDGANENPSWSPDGTRIAFSSGWLSVMDADGTDRRDFSNHESSIVDLAWSPDGTKVAASVSWMYDVTLITMNPWTGDWITSELAWQVRGVDWQPIPG